ncbi:hypothetical protein [Streptomyces syringium]|uniref:hypothetical protein n=1 Tax=Streptomyces syringium TaxID=76729 RepID=UPI003F50FA4F
MPTEQDEAKQKVRQHVWAALDAASAAYDDTTYGRIPNFKGADQAAERLAALPAWNAAATIKAVPDKAQLPVRARALAEGKTVYMAVPKLATPGRSTSSTPPPSLSRLPKPPPAASRPPLRRPSMSKAFAPSR